MIDPQIAIIDFHLGNMFSIQHACEYVGLNSVITSDKHVIEKADAAILPGVGAFGDAMVNLKRLDLVSPITDFINSGKLFMGICLGMQLLFNESEEFGNNKGLGIIDGTVVKFHTKKSKVPQIGWNQISGSIGYNWENTPLKGVAEGEYMYFVHSYYTIPSLKEVVLSVTNYEDIQYCSSIIYKNVFATQFHPEKSAEEGISIIQNWQQSLKTLKQRRN